jgi:hypothetical protein
MPPDPLEKAVRCQVALREQPMLRNLIPNLLSAWKLPRWRWALVIALLSDALGFGLVLVQPAEWLLDAVTAGVLFVVLGFRWPLLGALAFEAVPVLQVFPAWTLVVAALAGTETRKAPAGPGAAVPDARSIQK